MKPTAGALVPARFRERPNRFIVDAELEGGEQVLAHLGDPGRLRELLLPGAELRLRPAPPGGDRRTRYTVSLVRSSDPPRSWVSLETQRANHLAGQLLRSGDVRGIATGWTVRGEVRHGNSRLDFKLEHPRRRDLFVEVKSVTLVVDGVGRFPDAPTQRGTRHVRSLEAMVRDGGRAMLLFIAQRADVRSVEAAMEIDPAFAAALADARSAGVELRAARFRLSADGRARHLGAVPVRTHSGAGRRSLR